MQKTHLYVLAALLLGVTACSDEPPQDVQTPRRQINGQAQLDYADKEFAVYDPAEGVNKQIYKFNAKLDEYVLLPIVNGYVYVTPEFARNRVTDFFLNVGEVNNFTNAVFQIKPEMAGITLGRFVVNTTVGLLGTFDVASEWGMQRQPDDFGKTLGYWGAGSGPYIVLPVLGPSNLRDATGLAVDFATLTILIPDSVRFSTAYEIIAYGLQPINMRYNNGFRYYSSGSPFEYEIVRYILTQTRNAEIEKLKHPQPDVTTVRSGSGNQ